MNTHLILLQDTSKGLKYLFPYYHYVQKKSSPLKILSHYSQILSNPLKKSNEKVPIFSNPIHKQNICTYQYQHFQLI